MDRPSESPTVAGVKSPPLPATFRLKRKYCDPVVDPKMGKISNDQPVWVILLGIPRRGTFNNKPSMDGEIDYIKITRDGNLLVTRNYDHVHCKETQEGVQ